MAQVMFAKLNSTFEKPLYTTTQDLKSFKGDDGKGIQYKMIWSPDAENLYSVLPRRYWKDFHITEMKIDCAVPPHTDTEIVTSINFYIQTEGCKTTFYKTKVDEPKTFKMEQQTNGRIFYPEDLEEVDSFVAKDYEIWVLDVSQIHGVSGDFNLRKAITLGTFIHKYEDVIEMLKETKNVVC
jgi:hypothetical protein